MSVSYTNDIYDLTDKLPGNEKYNLIDQLKRASLSISNNIAEDSGATTKKIFFVYEYKRMLCL